MADRRIFALTVIQPWASLLALGLKRVENRTWEPRGLREGDYLALHAGAWHTRQGGPIEEWVSAMELARNAGLLPSIPLLAEFHQLTTGERGRFFEARCKAHLERAVPYGAIVGVARFDGCNAGPRGVSGESASTILARGGDLLAPEPRDPWFCGPVGWYLRDVVAIKPVPCKGAQGLWSLPPEVLADVRRRWREVRDG